MTYLIKKRTVAVFLNTMDVQLTNIKVMDKQLTGLKVIGLLAVKSRLMDWANIDMVS